MNIKWNILIKTIAYFVIFCLSIVGLTTLFYLFPTITYIVFISIVVITIIVLTYKIIESYEL
jgi:hypothetical protein